MRNRLVLLLSCLALVAAGCGSEDDDGGGGGGAATSEQPREQAPETERAAGSVSVSMKNTLYVPRDVKVKAGGTIEWTNDDPFPHTVTKQSGPGPAFDSGTVDGGRRFRHKFTSRGTIDYVCKIHPNQTGTITVE